MIARWSHASPALQAALAGPLASRLDTFYQLRYRAVAGQIRQLETTTGITLLRAGQDGTITLTADGEQFARDVSPVLSVLALAGDAPIGTAKGQGPRQATSARRDAGEALCGKFSAAAN